MKHNYMKKIAIRILILLIASTTTVKAQQITDYTFASSSGTYTPLTGATVMALTAGNPDDGYYNGAPLGFTFCYMGASYTTFNASTNGWGSFLPLTANSLTNDLTFGGTPRPVIAPLWDDLEVNAGGSFSYLTTGAPGSRIFTAQWMDIEWDYQAAGPVISFQVKLYEGTNVIEFVYEPGINTVSTPSASVGITTTPTGSGNFLSVNSLSLAATVSSTTETNTVGTLPPSGLTFSFTPPATPASPTSLTFTGVTATAMTVNWQDNSTTESAFTVWRSTDNITFTQVATVTSTSTATTGNPYSYNATMLSSNTVYYWRIFAVNANCPGTPLSGSQSTLAGTLCGTYTIGPTGAYTSLTAAIAAVQSNGLLCPVIFELQAAYVSSVETFPIVVPFLGGSSTNTITVRPELAATNLSITSASTVTIDMSGSTYFMFDGRPGGTGTVRHLTIENTSTTGIAARFINDAQFCGYTYCKIRGRNTSTVSGVVVFGIGATAAGNSNNTINNSELYDTGGTPTNMIYSSNALAGSFSTGNTISSNLIHDWFSATSVNNAILISTGNTAWTISNNSFYQTVTRTHTIGTTHQVINAASGSNSLTGAHVITGNFIGGTAPNCGGTPYTVNGTVATRYIAIQTTTGTGGANSIQGNTITNFNLTTTSGITTANGIWCGINMTGTNASNNVGTVTPNIIGSTTVNGQITTTSSVSGGLVVGINSSATGTQVISNNQIGGFTANTSSATVSSSIMGIQVTSGISSTISGNLIGSLTMASSMINAAAASGTGGQVTGIISTFPTASMISNNTVMNLTNQYTGTSTIGQTRGIATTGGVNTITGNTIANLAGMSSVVSATSPTVVGIAQTSTSAGHTVSNNTITNLGSGSTGGNISMVGIYYNGSTVGTNRIFNNKITGIGAPFNTASPVINGIYVNAGVSRFYNNMIVLGVDATGASLTASHEYNGIFKVTTANNSFFYNTVRIGGTGVTTGTANTYAFRRTAASGTDSLYNNVLTNFRSNSTGTGSHYLMGLANTTTFRSDYNDFYGNGTGYNFAIVGVTVYATLPAWAATTALDANSYFVDPNFISTINLHINNATVSVLESRALTISGINFDIDNDARPGPVGSVNGGGTVPDIGADEFDGLPVQIDLGVQTLVLPSVTGCHSANETVRVRVKNYATATIDFSVNPLTIVSYTQGVNPVSFPNLVINSGTLAGGGTLDTTVTTSYNMTALGVHTFRAYTNNAGDPITSNDSLAPVSITISGGTYVAASGGRLCLGANATLSVTGFTNGGTVQWEESADNITWTPIVGATTASYTITPTDTTFYRAVICGLWTSTADTVFPEYVPPPTTVGDTRCGPGPVTLSASGSGTLRWYDQPTAGTQVFSGTTYNTTVTATDTFYVENATGTPPTAVTTTFAGGNSFLGNMFAVTALNTITVTNFDGNVAAGTVNFEVWYMPQNYTLVPGATTSNASWTLLGTASNIVTAGTGNPTPIPINFNVTIPAGQTYSFYVTILAGTMNYTNGTAVNNVFTSTPDFQFREGHGGGYFALANSPRVWNGKIYYFSGCASTRVPVIANVTPAPAVAITAQDTIICSGDMTMLIANSPNQDYLYNWSPGTYLIGTTGDTVTFSPSVPGTYTYFVDASDTATGCLNRDTITVGMVLSPTVVASVSNDSICRGVSTNLSTVVNARRFYPDTAEAANTTTTYPAPYGNWYWGARHQFLITAAELQAAGMTAGPIEGLSFFVTTATTTPLSGFSIRMANTTLTTLPSAFTAATFTNCVFYPSYVPFTGENHHTFVNAFMWNGTDNVLIETCFNNTSFTTNCIFELVNTSYVSSVYYRADASGICGNASVTGTANQRPVMAFDSPTNLLNYAWTPISWLDDPTSASPVATPMMTTNYIITVTDTTSGCTAMDTVSIYIKPTPSPDLGPDTIICSNTPLLLDGSPGPYTYLWQDNSTAQTFTVTAFGNYSVYVVDTISMCAASDTALIGVNPAPSFTLGSDVTVCDGTPVSFSGPAGPYAYDWNTADTTQAITVMAGGSYDLRVTDTTNACFAMDTVMLNVNPLPPVALGSDTAICDVDAPVTLTAPSGNYSYSWSDMSTSQTLDVSVSGTYYVVVTDNATNCADGDTVSITVNSTPAVTLGSDTSFCSADGPITLVGPSGPFMYQWSDMSTGVTLTTNATGVYSLLVTDSVNGCYAADTIAVNVGQTPLATINDTSLCGTAYALMAPITSNASYLWSTSDTTSSIIVNSPGGTFTVTVTDNASNCAASDAATVMVNTPPTVTFSIQATACTTDGIITLTGSPAGGTFSGPGVAGNTFNPATAGAGTFVITYDYTDTNGCSGADSSTIVISPCVGVNDPLVAAGMNVFPNPNNGYFMLTIANANYSEVTIELLSVDGKIVYSDKVSDVKGNYTKELDLATEGNGIYFLRITADGQTFMQKVVKQE
jgi:hypothetical protein